MEWVLLEVSPSQRLIIGKDNFIVFGVSLVTPLHHPVIVVSLLWSKPTNVVRPHVKVRFSINDPACKLISTARTKHHADGVEAAAVKEVVDAWIGTLWETNEAFCK